MGGISLTFLVVDKIVDEFSVGGISLTLGGYITHKSVWKPLIFLPFRRA